MARRAAGRRGHPGVIPGRSPGGCTNAIMMRPQSGKIADGTVGPVLCRSRVDWRASAPVTRFLCDEMLGRLARYLRAAGYDTALAAGGLPDSVWIGLAQREARLLLTCDRSLGQGRNAAGLVLELAQGDLDRRAGGPESALSGRLAVAPVFALPGRQHPASPGGRFGMPVRHPAARSWQPVHLPAMQAASTGPARITGARRIACGPGGSASRSPRRSAGYRLRTGGFATQARGSTILGSVSPRKRSSRGCSA